MEKAELELDITWEDGACAITGFDSFDLHSSCHCGQAFRWRRSGPKGQIEEGVVRGKLLRLEQCSDMLLLHPPVDEEAVKIVIDYFRLRFPHGPMEEAIAGTDEIMRAAVERNRGLRIVAQEPWECLISYIISARNSIRQISRTVERIAQIWGAPICDVRTPSDCACHDELADQTMCQQWDNGNCDVGERLTPHAFPGPDEMGSATVEDLVECKTGFRARSVWEAVCRVSSGEIDLDTIASLDYPLAKEELMRLRGVGEKVADCVLLFSMGKHEAFPVDVWIERAVRHLYFDGVEISHREIRKWAAGKFGQIAGHAQEYLFAYAREEIPEKLRKG
ncbi:MAG: DNA glycosylase [Firmicutes bacterium]|nr:DNA glycosylase [Bacillota bacterium]MDD4336522.1 DNA glycosylase [Bacillota bacterium]